MKGTASFLPNENLIDIRFPYTPLMVERIRTLPGRKWDKTYKRWTVPFSLSSLEKLKEWGIVLDVSLLQKEDTLKTQYNQIHSLDLPNGLFPFQKEGVEFIEKTSGRALIADEMGCISGEATICVNRAKKGFKIKLKDAYKRFNHLTERKNHNWDLSVPTMCKCLKEDGTFGLNKIRKILYQGKKKTITLKLESGKELILTPDHELLNETQNWRRADTFSIGEKILVNGTKKIIGTERRKRKDGYIYLVGSNVKNHKRRSTSGLLEHIFIMGKHLKREIDFSKEEIHHKNGKEYVLFPKKERIVSIKLNKQEIDVYDIIMEGPNRNFVANSVVVHNCGKTIQSLAWLYAHPELRPALIVVPACLKLNWERKSHEWLINPTVQVLYGRQKKDSIWCEDIIITNYDLLIMDITKKETLAKFISKNMNIKVMIIDECSYISNPQSQRSKAVKCLSMAVPHIVALSGTPITSRPKQFFPILNALHPNQFPSFFHYAQRYCGPRMTPWGWDFDGASNMEELHSILSEAIMIRRKKKDVLKDLPDKLKSVVPIDIDNREEYNAADENYIEWLKSQGQKSKAERASRAEVIAKTEGMRQLAVKGKMKSVIAWIEDFLNASDEKLIVFTYHIWARDKLYETFKNVAVLSDGGTNVQKAEDVFQNNKETRIFIGNISSSGMGITLTASSNVVFVEYPWTPDLLQQAEDRAHRIGQNNKVTIHYLVAQDTADEDGLNILDKKKVVLSKILDGEDVENEDLISVLLNQIKERKKKHV